MDNLRYFLLSCLLIFPSLLYAQEGPSLSKPELEYRNDTVIIRYSINQCRNKDFFKVWIDAQTDAGGKLFPRSLSGDVGDIVPCGENKVIYWDLLGDSVVLNDAVAIKVMASVNQHFKKPNFFLSSLVLPGSGIMLKKKNRKPYWLMGVAGYAGLSVSLHFYQSSRNIYKDYSQELDPVKKQQFYDSYVQKQNMMKVSLISTGTIWLTNLIWTIAAKEPESVGLSLSKTNNIGFSASTFQGLQGSLITFHYRF